METSSGREMGISAGWGGRPNFCQLGDPPVPPQKKKKLPKAL